MNIVDFIKNLRDQGLTDDQVIQEITRKYPEKGKVFNEAYKRNASSGQIIEEIIRQNSLSETPQPDQSKTIEEAKKRIESLKKEEFPKKEEAPIKEEEEEIAGTQGFEPKTKEEILDEFLKRKIASEGIQEFPAQKETGEEAEYPVGEIIKPLPAKQGTFKKFLIRFIIFTFILIVLAGIILFWLWYFVWQPSQRKCSVDSDCKEGYICKNRACLLVPTKCFLDNDCFKNYFCDNENCKKTTFPVSESVFPVENTAVMEISSLEEIKNLLALKTQEWVNADTFKRIVFINKNDGKEIGLKEFFGAMGAKAPDDFFSKLENNFTFFVYSQIQGNRIGFVVKIQNQDGFSKLLKSMEPALEKDFNPFYLLATEEQKYAKAVFKDSISVKSYSGPNFRFKILGSHDSGIYYLPSGTNYFIFTTSWRSMEKIISKLNIIQ